jgi:copper chaperone CopZ
VKIDVLRVPGIGCARCASAIRDALGPLVGVEAVQVDVAGATVCVGYDPAAVGIDRIRRAIEDEAYPVAAVESLG